VGRSRPGAITYRVTDRDQGIRLDLFLKERIPRMSREGIKEAIRTRVDIPRRTRVRPSTTLLPGDEVIVDWPRAGEDDPVQAAAAEPIRVLRDDGVILAVDKPAGLIVHATARSRGVSLLGILAAKHDPLHLVHRLDRETSGVVVLARTMEAARILSSAFASGEVEKIYVAIVFGVVGRDEGAIDLPIGKDSRSAVHVKQGVDASSGRPARTEFRVVERLEGFTLLELHPRTGRRHQIRVHLQAIGHPLVGDKLYGAREAHYLRFLASGFDEKMKRDLIAERQLLHAARVTLRHPRTARRVTIASPIPGDMAAFIGEHRGPSWVESGPASRRRAVEQGLP